MSLGFENVFLRCIFWAMPKLIVTTTTLPLRLDDARPRFVFDLARELTKQFDTVQILAPAHPDAGKRDLWDGVEIRRYRYSWPASSQRLCYEHGTLPNLQKKPWLAALVPMLCLSQLIAILRHIDGPDDVLNSHWLVPQGVIGAFARRFRRFRHVLQVHAAGLYLCLRFPRWIGRPLARFIVGGCDEVICVSNYVRDKLDELLGAPSRASICSMGVNIEVFRRSSGCPEEEKGHLLFFGRFVEKKGVEYLLQSMPEVCRQRPGTRLTLVGSGSLDDSLRDQANALDLPKGTITFVGSQPHDVLRDYIHRASVVVVPSIVDRKGETEGMPTVIVEAMAAGKRIVASRVNGTPDVVEDLGNGWLANPKDSEDLAEKIILALDDDEQIFLEAVLQTAERYTWAKRGELYAQILETTR